MCISHRLYQLISLGLFGVLPRTHLHVPPVLQRLFHTVHMLLRTLIDHHTVVVLVSESLLQYITKMALGALIRLSVP